MQQCWQYINGKLVTGKGKLRTVINPATEEVVAEYQGADASQAEEALCAAQKAFPYWSELSLGEREKYISALADAFQKEKDRIVSLLIEETGKPLETALYDFQMLLDCLHFFMEEAKRIYGEIISDYDDTHRNYIFHKPIGVVVGYLAWNFPLLNVGYKLGPILASGCTCVLKPSSLTPLATLLLGEIAEKIGFPPGVINILCGDSAEVAKTMNQSGIPRMITLIGSSQTGKEIVAQSSNRVRHYSLELGGNAPVIVLKDASVSEVARRTVCQKFDNCGQVCVAPNRVFVHESQIDEFLQAAQNEAEKIVLTYQQGDGLKWVR